MQSSDTQTSEWEGEEEMKRNIIVDCKNGHVFRLGLTDDGFKDCPDCGELLSNPKEGANTFGLLTIGQAWRNKRKAERMQSKENKASGLSIAINMDTNKMQLKLRAIAKHVEALADELDAIDNVWQCDCGSFEYKHVYKRGQLPYYGCAECEEEIESGDLPTHLEGID